MILDEERKEDSGKLKGKERIRAKITHTIVVKVVPQANSRARATRADSNTRKVYGGASTVHRHS